MDTTEIRWNQPRAERLANWGEGPWIDEPDEVVFEAHGRPCQLLRNRITGSWCGYVSAGHTHWAAEPDFNLLTEYLDNSSAGRRLYPHGGITYSSGLLLNASTLVDPKLWWVGFDAAHAGDLIPMVQARCDTFQGAHPDLYRGQAYMMAECARLAQALITLPGPGADG